jgi:hypothetical protein
MRAKAMEFAAGILGDGNEGHMQTLLRREKGVGPKAT